MENDVELVDLQETTTVDETVSESSSTDQDEALRSRLAKAEGYISDLKATANVSSVKELKEKLMPRKEEKKEEPTSSTDIEEIKLRLDGHDADEINIITMMAKGLGKRPTEALSDPLVKKALEGLKTDKRSSQATPEPSTRVHIVGDKTFNELNSSDKKKNYSQTVQTLVDRARNRNKNLT